MNDDVKITIGVDSVKAEQALDRLEKKFDQTAVATDKMGASVSHVGAGIDENGVQFDQLGNKSQRAAASIAQVGLSLQELETGNVSVYSLVNLTREAEHVTHRLEQSVSRLGAQYEGVATVLGTIGGFIGPAGVIIAGASVLYSVWRGISESIERSKREQEELHKANEESLKRQIEAIRSAAEAQRDLNELTLHQSARDELKSRRDMERQVLSQLVGPHGDLNPAIVNALAQPSMGQQEHAFKQSDAGKKLFTGRDADKTLNDLIADQREQLESLQRFIEKNPEYEAGLEDAREQITKVSTKLHDLLRARETMEDKAAAEARESLVKALSENKAYRELREKLTDEDRKAIDDGVRQLEQKQAALDAEKMAADLAAEAAKTAAAADKARHEEKARNQAQEALVIAQTGETYKSMLAAGMTVNETMDALEKALREEGTVSSVSDTLRKAVDAINQPLRGFAELQRVVAERQKVEADALQIQKQIADERQKLDEQELAMRKQQEQVVLAQFLEQAVALLKQLNGNEVELNRQLVNAFKKQGMDPLTAARRADFLVEQAKAKVGQGNVAEDIGRAMKQVTGAETVQDIFKRMVVEEKSGTKGPIAQDRVAEIRKAAEAEFQKRFDAERKGLAERQKERREGLHPEGVAGELSKTQKDALDRADRMEREALERSIAQRHGPRAAAKPRGQRAAPEGDIGEAAFGDVPDDQAAGAAANAAAAGAEVGARLGAAAEPLTDAADKLRDVTAALGQSNAAAMQDVAGTLVQLAATIANMTSVNDGVRQAAQSARQMLPGPGAWR